MCTNVYTHVCVWLQMFKNTKLISSIANLKMQVVFYFTQTCNFCLFHSNYFLFHYLSSPEIKIYINGSQNKHINENEKEILILNFCAE